MLVPTRIVQKAKKDLSFRRRQVLAFEHGSVPRHSLLRSNHPNRIRVWGGDGRVDYIPLGIVSDGDCVDRQCQTKQP